MHGAGNDYIYVDTARNSITNPSETAIKWSKPHTGIGSDGLILIGRSNQADFSMHMYNNDGSEGLMCGNGIRCIGKYVYDHRLTRNKTVSIETLAGIKVLKLFTNEYDQVESATVDMGEPILSDQSQIKTPDGSMQEGIIEVGERKYQGTFVSMGNPHFVIFVPDLNRIDLAVEGCSLERLPIFPEKCNIEFAEVKSDGTIRTRVWERGSGITMACGTGACATAVAAVLCNKSGYKSTIVMDGGNLEIEWNQTDRHVYLTGPATTVFEGEIEL